MCGTINSSAQEKSNKEGGKFIAFTMTVPLQGKDGSVCELFVHVSAPGDRKEANHYSNGKHVICNGKLSVRKMDDRVYYNVRCDDVPEIVKPDEPDRIEGTLDFSGAIGKKGIITKKDKKGKDYHLFSAWSSDKHDDKKEFTWVKFIHFNPKPDVPTAPGTYIDVYGDLDIDIFKGNANIECRVTTIKEHAFDDVKSGGTASSVDNK